MANCYCCKKDIAEINTSDEHVIPNFLGGVLKLKNKLCKICNETLGSTVDKELNNQLKWAADTLSFKRDRPKKNKRIDLAAADGQNIPVGEHLQPLPFLQMELPKEEIRIYVSNQEELDSLTRRKVKELEKSGKYKNINVSKLTEHKHEGLYYFQNNLSRTTGEMGFGGVVYFRALTKIALNYALYNNVDFEDISHNVISFVKDSKADKKYCWFYYPTHYKIHELKDNEISHLLYLYGCPKENVLYAYIELLNFECCIVLLNDNYTGPRIESTYCYDLIESKQLNKSAKTLLRKFHILECLEITSKLKVTVDMHSKKLNTFISKVESTQ